MTLDSAIAKVKLFANHHDIVFDFISFSKQGWVLSYQTRKYMETGDLADRLPEQHRFLVRASDGKMFIFPTNLSEREMHHLADGEDFSSFREVE
jgi:hypothetical protein